MKMFCFRIVEVVRVDGSPGFVVQVGAPWWLRWLARWENLDNLQYGDINDARERIARAEFFYNGAKGRVVE